MERAVVLLSGGLDSATCLAIAVRERDAHALTFDYGSRHSREIATASAIARRLGASEHTVLEVGLDIIGGSSLTDGEVPVAKSGQVGNGIPTSYVPARNIIFLSLGVALAERIGAGEVYIGTNAIDYSGYPDCRPEFIEAFQQVIEKGTKTGVEGKGIRVKAPLMNMTKAQIIEKGTELGVPYELTWTCYEGGERACGKCEACVLRLRGFKEAGYEDPVEYDR